MVPDKPEVLTGATAIAASGLHTCALLADGGVRCWGHNGVGQLGDGTTQDRASPPSRDAFAGAIGIATGGSVTCAITASRGLRCWGTNQNGPGGEVVRGGGARGLLVGFIGPRQATFAKT